MQISKNPMFSKREQPWYRTAPVYLFLSLIPVSLTIFGVIGIDVAVRNERYQEYLWVPLLLVLCAAALFIAIIVRLIRCRKNMYAGKR